VILVGLNRKEKVGDEGVEMVVWNRRWRWILRRRSGRTKGTAEEAELIPAEDSEVGIAHGWVEVEEEDSQGTPGTSFCFKLSLKLRRNCLICLRSPTSMNASCAIPSSK